MGFSTIVGTAIIILGVASVLVAMYPILESGVRDVSDAFRIQNEAYTDKQGTALEVVGITVEGDCSSYNLTIVLNNTGNRELRFDKIDVLDNNNLLGLNTTSITDMFHSTKNADGYIVYDGSIYAVDNSLSISYIGNDTNGQDREYRSYLSFNTSGISDDATVVGADLYVKAGVFTTDVIPTWNVDYYCGNNVTGDTLTQGAWGSFTYFGQLDYEETTGWKNISVPASYITKAGDVDFELRPNMDVGNNNVALIEISQTEAIEREDNPYLEITYSLANPLSGVLVPTKDINMIYYDMSSADDGHTVVVVTENGISAYGTYYCS